MNEDAPEEKIAVLSPVTDAERRATLAHVQARGAELFTGLLSAVAVGGGVSVGPLPTGLLAQILKIYFVDNGLVDTGPETTDGALRQKLGPEECAAAVEERRAEIAAAIGSGQYAAAERALSAESDLANWSPSGPAN